MKKSIKITKNDAETEINKNNYDQKKEKAIEEISSICAFLLSKNNEFNTEKCFECILDYIKKYDRILYAPISGTIYSVCASKEHEKSSDIMGNITSNIDKVKEYAHSDSVNDRIRKANNTEKKQLLDTQKSILKIWDHINLAYQQYDVLRQSDEETNKKIDLCLEPFQKKITQEISSQLLTMLGIFTALAFLLFGGISSLENLFSNSAMPILKFMVIGSIWSLCLLNLLFIFLYCVLKIIKISPVNNDDSSISRKYAIFWWTNFIVISIMIFSLWGYYLTSTNSHDWVNQILLTNPLITTLFIILILILIAFGLYRKTKHVKK